MSPHSPAAPAALADRVNVQAEGLPRPVEEPPGTMLPFPAGGTFAPQAEQFLAIEDAARRLVKL